MTLNEQKEQARAQRNYAEVLQADYDAKWAIAQAEIDALKLRHEAALETEAGALRNAVEFAQTLETNLREAIKAEYAATGEKQVGDGMSVRVNKRFDYDDATALNWAIEHKMCLALDKTKFKKVAAVDTPSFVTIVEDVTAVISWD